MCNLVPFLPSGTDFFSQILYTSFSPILHSPTGLHVFATDFVFTKKDLLHLLCLSNKPSSVALTPAFQNPFSLLCFHGSTNPIPIINILIMVYPRYLFMWLSSLTSECLASEMKVLVTSYSLCLASIWYVVLCWVNIGIWVMLQSYTWTLSLQGRSFFFFFESFQKRWDSNVNDGPGSTEIVPLHYAMKVESLK